MRRRPIQVDWDELEAAFENRSADLSYYFDTVTGQVGLEGQGEDTHFDDDELDNAVDAPAALSGETTRLVITSYSDLDELDWMDEFIEGEKAIGEALKDKLGDLVAREDGDGFKDALRQHAEVRDRWFLFRSERVHEVMDAWLEENHVTPAAPPPWKER
jgi:hypothetical protein